jgi:alginate O-acetyltransferase complex protein AlgI
MMINSNIFIFIILPLIVIIYYLLNFLFRQDRINRTWLILCSFLIYSSFGFSNLIYLLFSFIINFKAGQLILKKEKKLSTFILTAGIILNVCFWLLLKYKIQITIVYNLFFETYYKTPEWVMPLAFGLITIQQISYLIECHRKEIINNNAINYLTYSVFFPKLIAGPLIKFNSFNEQFRQTVHKVNYNNISAGLFIFFSGLFQKVIISDTFEIIVNNGFHCYSLNFAQAWIVSLCNLFYIYFDINAYTNMAIGTALFFNVRLPDNFNYPFKALNIKDFWSRWHITFTGFFMNNICVAQSKRKIHLVNYGILLLITFLAMSIWHKAALQMIIWGMLNASALIVFLVFRKIKIPNLLSWVFTFSFLAVSWLFFSAQDISDAIMVIKGMLNFKSIFIYYNELYILWAIEANFIIVLLLIFCLYIVLKIKNTKAVLIDFKPSYKYLFLTVAYIITVLLFNSCNPFLYYGF